MLKVENIRFGYVPSVDIFRDVTFTIEGGEYIAIGGRTITAQILRLCRHLNVVNSLAMYSNNRIAKCSDQP